MKIARYLGAFWGIVGVSIILGSAIIRVMPHVFEAMRSGMSASAWTVIIAWSGLMVVAEGYRGFQKQFSPRVAARAWHLLHHGERIDLILAPLYCIGYFHADRRRVLTSWSLTLGIVLVVAIVRYLPQPWRGIIDSGVVLGLLYGLISVYIVTIQTFRNQGATTNSKPDIHC